MSKGDTQQVPLFELSPLRVDVAHGGNFLLNIGPKGDGSVVPFEREVPEV